MNSDTLSICTELVEVSFKIFAWTDKRKPKQT